MERETIMHLFELTPYVRQFNNNSQGRRKTFKINLLPYIVTVYEVSLKPELLFILRFAASKVQHYYKI